IVLQVVVSTPTNILPDGDYRFFTGSSHIPATRRYFTTHINSASGRVELEKLNPSLSGQSWVMHNQPGNDMTGSFVTLESHAQKGHFLSLSRGGANPGAHLGVTTNVIKWIVRLKHPGGHPTYALAYPI
ncbi:hypothetical protein FBU30_009040, partial [Linnemannia zychae]